MKPKYDLKSISKFHILLSILGGLVLLFIIAPLASLIFSSSGTTVLNSIRDPEIAESIWRTISISMLATFVCSFFAIPLGYVLARYSFPFKSLISTVIELPIVIPHSAAGIALLIFFSRALKIDIIDNTLGIALAMSFVSIPFLISSARTGFSHISTDLEKAALSLGASPLRVFFTITIPLAKNSIISGILLMWGRGMSEFGAVIILAYHPMTTPVQIYDQFINYGLDAAKSIATILVLIVLIIFIGFNYVKSK